MGFADGYTDAVSTSIAQSCDGALAHQIWIGMLGTYIIGVVILQWCICGLLVQRDSSQACLLKLLHMDALAACITIPKEVKWIWVLVNVARTVGEDVPQCCLQMVFVLKVKRNYFMILSIIVSFGSSIKAIVDAISRSSVASGAYAKLVADEQACADDQEASSVVNGNWRVVEAQGVHGRSQILTFRMLMAFHVPTRFEVWSAHDTLCRTAS
mmetsp:Transcript_159461/g.507598  ORF Transcript_159461/g.507598 Transcript_159461/m.507598 type:complete len:212 (-) Transcript_159461:265-900(-)